MRRGPRASARQDCTSRMITATPMRAPPISPGIAGRLLAMFSDEPTASQQAYPFPQLTSREREILELLASGRRRADIAAELFLSPKTVSNQLTSIFAKLGAADRTEAAILARESGLGGSS
jgi:DNA-binding NarL/FixJ family response regulator